jgi:hypothetical protein
MIVGLVFILGILCRRTRSLNSTNCAEFTYSAAWSERNSTLVTADSIHYQQCDFRSDGSNKVDCVADFQLSFDYEYALPELNWQTVFRQRGRMFD